MASPSSTTATATATTTTSATSASTTSSSSTVNDTKNSESCSKCVQVLRDLVSGMQQSTSTSSSSSIALSNESKPLQILRAIAAGNPILNNNNNKQQQQQKVQIENVDDGIKMVIPVQTTAPTLLRRWSAWSQEEAQQQQQQPSSTLSSFDTRFGGVSAAAALATSADTRTILSAQKKVHDNENEDEDSHHPLTIELKCKKCASSGPEGGARAFLMGPSPLSVIVCHNRIQSNTEEIQEILTHELIHLYDVQTQQLDLQQCENLAYSEVRAAKHAECKDSWKQLQSYCVKQKAICATNNLFPLQGRQCIQKVFDKAFGDNRPFEQYNNNNNHNNNNNNKED